MIRQIALFAVVMLSQGTIVYPAISLAQQAASTPGNQASAAAPGKPAAEQFLVQGKPLAYWIGQAAAKEPAAGREAIVSALVEALGGDNVNVKVAAADALGWLGPRAKPAIPALVPLLSDSRPWVSSAGISGLAAIGKDAVPTLIEIWQKGTGPAKVRAAWALGGIGRDARDAAPVLAEAMKSESPLMQERLLGVLNLIEPEKYAARSIAGKASFDAMQTAAEGRCRPWPTGRSSTARGAMPFAASADCFPSGPRAAPSCSGNSKGSAGAT